MPCCCAYTDVKMRVIGSVCSYFFFVDTINVQVSLPLRNVGSALDYFSFFFSIDLTLGCASALHCSENVLHCCVILVAHP